MLNNRKQFVQLIKKNNLLITTTVPSLFTTNNPGKKSNPIKKKALVQLQQQYRPQIFSNLDSYKDVSSHQVVRDRMKQKLMTMKSTDIPKGVKFATLCMLTPLIGSTIGLCGVLSSGSYESVGFLARSSIRLLQLNLSFGSGLHYGFAAANYEVSINQQEIEVIKRQFIASITPAISSFIFTMPLLFWEPLVPATKVVCYSGLLATSLTSLIADKYFVNKSTAPPWLFKYKLALTTIYCSVILLLLTIHTQYPDLIKRRNDPNRIKNLKSAMELQQLDFLKMAGDMKLQYDAQDLASMEAMTKNNQKK